MFATRSLAVLALATGLFAGAAVAQSTSPPASGSPVERIVVRSVAHFEFDGHSIRADDRPGLLEEVGRIKNVTWQAVTATGYTDSVGARRYNEQLSRRRAAAVKAYLVKNGIDAAMVRVEGKADDTPIAPNDNADGRAQNRRTEIRFEGVRTAAN